MSFRPRRPPGILSLQRLAPLLLIAFALGAVIIEQNRPLHFHTSESPGLYNEQHLLAALLASPSSGVPLPDSSSLAFLVALVGLVVLPAPTGAPEPVVWNAAPRAPPTR